MNDLRTCSKRASAFLLLCLVTLSATSRNYFSPYTTFEQSLVPVCLSHEGQRPEVKQFEKIEIGFSLPAVFEAAVENPRKGLNPFDPDKVNVVAVFSNGARSDTVYGFYYREYIRDASTIKAVYENYPQPKWNEEFTEYKWRVRFATGQTGNWNVQIKVQVHARPTVTYVIDPFSFNVVPSQRTGFLATGADKLHFTESNGNKSFFLLGQDIAWPDGERFRGAADPGKPYLTQGGYMDVQDWVSNLAYSGGNTVRVVNVPWSYEYEWDTVGVYNMPHAWELDQLFATCEKNGVKIVFCMEHGTHTFSPWEGHLTWTKNPYNRFVPGVDHPEDFLSDSTARAQYKKKLRYFFARWGYSSSLGIFQLLSEMDNWTFGKPATQLMESKELQRINLAWHNEMLAYAKKQVAYRPLLTSTSYTRPPRDFSISAFSSPYVDVVCPRHCYFTERNDNLRRWGEVNRVSLAEPGIHELFPNKPAIIDEMGLGSSSGGDPGDVGAHSDVTYHNAIWSTAFSGTAGSGLYWWSWSSNSYRENNFPALRAFFRAVDFEAVSFTRPGHWEDANRPSRVSVETFYIGSADAARSHAMGWVHNASYWWGNISQHVKDRNGKTMTMNARTNDDAKIVSPTELPAGTKFEVHDLANGAVYALAWYNTRGAGGQSGYEEYRTNIFGTAKIAWRAGEADWGYKLDRKAQPKNNRNVTMTPDTVRAGEGIAVYGNHPLDVNGTFTYRWDFGNGTTCDAKNTAVVFNAGSFDVQLMCTDENGRCYSIRQTIVAQGQQDHEVAAFAGKRNAF